MPLDHLLKKLKGLKWDRIFEIDFLVQLRHLLDEMARALVCMVNTVGTEPQMTCHHPKTSLVIVYAPHLDSERPRSSSRNGSTSKRVTVSSNKPISSDEPSENRASRLVSSSARMSTTQRVQPGFESKSTSFTRTAGTTTRSGREDTLRSFELLTFGSGKRK